MTKVIIFFCSNYNTRPQFDNFGNPIKQEPNSGTAVTNGDFGVNPLAHLNESVNNLDPLNAMEKSLNDQVSINALKKSL